MANPLSVSRIVITISLLSLIVQIVASAYLIPKINQPIHVGYVLAALACEFLAFGVLAPFIKGYYQRESVPLSYTRSLALLLASESFSRLVPFGDYFVQRYYFDLHHWKRGAPLRYITILYCVGLLSLIALFLSLQLTVFVLYPNRVSNDFAGKFIYIPLVITAILIVLFLLRKRRRLTERLQSQFQKFLGSKMESPFAILGNDGRPLSSNIMLILPLLATWIFEGIAYTLCLKAFGVRAPLLLSLYAYTFVKMFRFIPIFPGGVGEIEATSSLLFSSYGFAIAPVITGSIVFRFVSYWFPVALGVVSARVVLRR